jgi:hypothetical protein
MATLIPFSTTVCAQKQESERAQKFIDLASRAKDRVDELISFIEGIEDEIDIPEELYSEGESKLADAVAQLDAEPDLAIELAKEAMIIFREVYGQLNALLEGEEADVAGETDEAETLMVAIERAEERIDRVGGIVESNIDYLTDHAKEELGGLLGEAEALLGEAKAALLEEVSTAAKKLGDAHKLISQAFVILKKAAGAINSERIKGFLTVIGKFYDRVVRLVERAVEQGLADPGEFDTELGEIEGLIEDAKDPDTPINDAIADLMEARIRLESIQRDILERRKGKSE